MMDVHRRNGEIDVIGQEPDLVTASVQRAPVAQLRRTRRGTCGG
jgi:hypothetical protein